MTHIQVQNHKHVLVMSHKYMSVTQNIVFNIFIAYIDHTTFILWWARIWKKKKNAVHNSDASMTLKQGQGQTWYELVDPKQGYNIAAKKLKNTKVSPIMIPATAVQNVDVAPVALQNVWQSLCQDSLIASWTAPTLSSRAAPFLKHIIVCAVFCCSKLPTAVAYASWGKNNHKYF